MDWPLDLDKLEAGERPANPDPTPGSTAIINI